MRKRLLRLLGLVGLLLALAIPMAAPSYANGLSIFNFALPDGEVGAAYSQALTATDGTPPYHWAITSGGPLPAGLLLNPNSGVISGVPTAAAAAATYTFEVTDSQSDTATKDLSITILAAPSITTDSLPDGVVGIDYSKFLEAEDGTLPYIWSIQTGVLPGGLTLFPATGEIWGQPGAAGGPVNVTFRVNDGRGVTATKVLAITINATVPTVTTATVSNIIVTAAIATGNGTVVADGGSPVTERGIVWNTAGNPTISDNHVSIGGEGTGQFSLNMTDLMADTLYYVRAYALNSIGPGYGNQVTFIIFGNVAFSTSEGVIEDLQTVEVPADPPSGAVFPFGFFRFRITDLSPGEAVDVTITLPLIPTVESYWKYGPLTDINDNEWYNFEFDNGIGAEIDNNIITLHFKDGERGDGDLVNTNGIIVDPGGPAAPSHAVPGVSIWGIITLALLFGGIMIRMILKEQVRSKIN